MLTLVTISFCIFVAYILSTVYLFGVPSSISDTFYLLEAKKRNLGGAFTLMMFSIGFLIISPFIEITPENWEFLPFLSVAGILFVGAAPLFKRGGTDTLVHTYGAISAGAFSLLWLFICYPEIWGSLVDAVVVACIGLFLSRRAFDYTYLFWIEIVLFLTIYFSLFRIL